MHIYLQHIRIEMGVSEQYNTTLLRVRQRRTLVSRSIRTQQQLRSRLPIAGTHLCQKSWTWKYV